MTNNEKKAVVVITVAAGTYDGVLAGWELSLSPPRPPPSSGGGGGGEQDVANDDDGEKRQKRRRRRQKGSSYRGKFQLAFASPVHVGSVRSLCLGCSTANNNAGGGTAAAKKKKKKKKKKKDEDDDDDDEDGRGSSGTSPRNKNESSSSSSNSTYPLSLSSLLSCGYDETLLTHSLFVERKKRLLCDGRIATPAFLGTPTCSSFAPPPPPTSRSSSSSSSSTASSTHCVVGFASGKILIYKKRDWTVQHVLDGHSRNSKNSDSYDDGVGGGGVGVSSLAVHPASGGAMLLSGGTSDGLLKLWDLTTGELAHVDGIRPTTSASATGDPVLRSRRGGRSRTRRYDPIASIAWLCRRRRRRKRNRRKRTSDDGRDRDAADASTDGDDDDDDEDVVDDDNDMYGFCCGSRLTVRSVGTGEDLLDAELPSRINQMCLLEGPEGVFAVAACDDGSLPVVAVALNDGGGGGGERQNREHGAVMAIEPASATAGEERFKCVHAVVTGLDDESRRGRGHNGNNYLVATANSAGVVSLMDLQGAVNMIVSGGNSNSGSSGNGDGDGDGDGSDDGDGGDEMNDDKSDDVVEQPVRPESDGDQDDDQDDRGNDGDSSSSDTDGSVELAVDLIDSVRLGSGARITCLAAWSAVRDVDDAEEDEEDVSKDDAVDEKKMAGAVDDDAGGSTSASKRKRAAESSSNHDVGTKGTTATTSTMDADAAAKARRLVAKAKKLQHKQEKKKRKLQEEQRSAGEERKTGGGGGGGGEKIVGERIRGGGDDDDDLRLCGLRIRGGGGGSGVFDAVSYLDSQDAHAERRRRTSKRQDRQRSEAAQSQAKIYGGLVECRILFQRALQMTQAAALPAPEDSGVEEGKTAATLSNGGGNIDSIDSAIDLSNDLLANLLEARRTLLQGGGQNRNVCQEVNYEDIVAARSLSSSPSAQKELDDVLQSEYEAFREEWKEVLDRRNKDVRLRSGLTAAKDQKFRVLDSSFWQQVESTVQHEELQRQQRQQQQQQSQSGAITSFDDSKVYQQMLKDFVTTGQAGGDTKAAQLRLQKQSRKNSGAASGKPDVDRKASKGRKIRYVEIPKLVNFTFPLSRPSISSAAKTSNLDEDEWFRSLFGGASASKASFVAGTIK